MRALVFRLLEKRPDDRPADATAVIAMLTWPTIGCGFISLFSATRR